MWRHMVKLLRVVVACAIVAMGTGGCGESAARRVARTAAEAKAAAAAEAEAKARAEVVAAREAERLRALWIYSDTPAGRGRELSAQLRSTNDVDTDGTGGRRVLLVFRDHPAWGQSSYLVLSAGDFRCAPRCMVSVTFDAAAPMSVAAHEPRTDEATAMFIDDWQRLWRSTAGAATLSIEFPVAAGGTRTASFDVAGLDRAKMPAWDRLAGTRALPQ